MNLIFLDFESFYGDGFSLSLKDMTTEKYIRSPEFKAHGFSFAVNNGPIKWVTAKYMKPVLAKLDIPNNVLIGHNLQFDGSILAWHEGIYPKLYIDTLGLSRAMVGPHSARHGLTYVAKLLCDLEKLDGLAKTYNVRDLPPDLEAALATYCNHDVHMTREIFKKLIKHFPKSELKPLDWTIRAFTDPKLVLDVDMLKDYQHELAVQKREALEAAGLTSRDMLMSNPQYAMALEAFGVNPPTKISAKTGKVSYAFAKTDEAHIALLEHDDIRVQSLVAARLEHKSTIEETRAALYIDAGGRGFWPVGYNYAGAQVTQRMSGNKGGGGNPQNLRRGGKLRKAILAALRSLLGVADLSQIEARITLWFGMQIAGPDSEEANALKVMLEGGDIYSWFGSKMYGYKISKKTHPLERQIAKSAVLGLGFGMGWERFIEYCKQSGIKGVDEKFAQDIVKLYRSTFKGVAAFWRQCNKALNLMIDGQFGYTLPFESQCTAPGIVLPITTQDPLFNQPAILRPDGLCIKYPDLEKSPEGEITYQDGAKRVKLFGGKVCENLVQSVAADILREQLTRLQAYYPVVMQTHDELVCVIPEEDGDVFEWDEESEKNVVVAQGRFSKTATLVMCKPISYMPGLPLDVETGTGAIYGEAKA